VTREIAIIVESRAIGLEIVGFLVIKMHASLVENPVISQKIVLLQGLVVRA
jgi:hypothetical protein